MGVVQFALLHARRYQDDVCHRGGPHPIGVAVYTDTTDTTDTTMTLASDTRARKEVYRFLVRFPVNVTKEEEEEEEEEAEEFPPRPIF